MEKNEYRYCVVRIEVFWSMHEIELYDEIFFKYGQEWVHCGDGGRCMYVSVYGK